MKVGAILPQMEMAPDVGALKAWVEAVEDLGFDHIVLYDHVLGVDPVVHEGWSGFYDIDTRFHEIFVTLGYLAAITSLELAAGILVLPQRQAGVVAKQATEVSILTGGKFRLGVAAGWNAVEMEALGMPFSQRGSRMDDQIELMRELWSQRTVQFHSRYHDVEGVGLSPLPAETIPVWIGGIAPPALRRVGRLGDGWFAPYLPDDESSFDQLRSIIDAAAVSAGRDPASVDTEGRVNATKNDLGDLAATIERWQTRNVSHVSVATMKDGLHTVDQHIDRLRTVADILQLGRGSHDAHPQ